MRRDKKDIIVTVSGGLASQFSTRLESRGNHGGFVDLMPKDGEYNGTATVYNGTFKSAITHASYASDISIDDEQYPNRFTLLTEIKDYLTQNVYTIWRDFKENNVIMIQNINLPQSVIDNCSGELVAEYQIIGEVKGIMDDTLGTKVAKCIILTSNSGNDTNSSYMVKSGSKYINQSHARSQTFFSLGSSEEILGTEALPEVRTKITTSVVNISHRKCENLILQVGI